MSTAIKTQHASQTTHFDQLALEAGEATRSANGAICVETGARTGRSPKDRFIVQDAITQNTVDWGPINQPMTPEVFAALWQKATDHLAQHPHHTQDLRVGWDVKHTCPVHVVTEYAWHAMFTQNMFVQPMVGADDVRAAWTLWSLPNLTLAAEADGVASDAAVVLDFTGRRVLICGMRYAGEMKKAMFSVMNFLLPEEDVLPMHCSANVGHDGRSALFFGLSGTGKTTLSADPDRLLVGDDEHGWSRDGIFNFEGGCYAKCIGLSPVHEPVIHQAIRAGAVMENVVLDAITQMPDFADTSKTKNTRVSYPLGHIAARVANGRAPSPKAVIFLTCDLYGVLPPMACLTHAQAAYYFLSGYTALVGSTEMGSRTDVQPTFSTCFGAPFFPRPPEVYAALLQKRLADSDAQVFLVNTGWYGGQYGSEHSARYPISVTRQVVHAAIDGAFDPTDVEVLPGFGLHMPRKVDGVDASWLDPRQRWQDPKAYDEAAKTLIKAFSANIAQFSLTDDVLAAGPSVHAL